MEGEARRIDKPEEGYWMMRLRKNAPEVPACIVRVQTTFEPSNPTNLMDRSPFLAAMIRGEPVELHEVWERRGRQITKEEYDYQMKLARWADNTEEATALAEPAKPVDLNALPSLF